MGLFDFLKKKKKPAPAAAPRPAAPTPPPRPAPKPAARDFAPYTGGGVCDVCNQPLSGRQAWIVPNDVFYGSRQYREHLKGTMRMMGISPTEADVERMRLMDHSPGSAVCQNCIHMFK